MSSNDSTPVRLVVGSDSLVGRAYYESLKMAGLPVLGTTRRRDALDESHVFLDLSEDLSEWLCPPSVEVGVLCAGVTNLAACLSDPVATTRVNVEGNLALAAQLTGAGTRVIYLSTSRVFDGSTGFCSTDDPWCPATEYGRQNAEAERRLQALGDLVTIVRFTKILGPNVPLLVEWVQALQRGEPFHPYSDLVMAPLPVWFVVKVIDRVVRSGLGGVFQVSGNRDVTYEEAARIGAASLGLDATPVRPAKVVDSDRYNEPILGHTTMDNSRLNSELGMNPPDVLQTLREVFIEIGAATGGAAELTKKGAAK